MKRSLSLIAALSGASMLAEPAQAGWIQSFGQSERCISLGGACVAKRDDFGAYYHNPSAAAWFDGAVVGGNFRLLDTTYVDLIDSGGEHRVENTNTEGQLVLAPTLAGYVPITDNLTVGLGFGAPFAITADWTNEDGIHRFNFSDQSLFVLELSPNVAYRVTDKFSIGAAFNIVAFKQLRTETLVPLTFGAALPPALGGAGAVLPVGPDTPVIGSITIESDRDLGLGIPPDGFASSFDEFSFTLGAQYLVNDRLSLGAVYRTKTDLSFEGTLALDLTPAGLGAQTVGFETDLDTPGHLQLGANYSVIPGKLDWSLDLQWTFWSDTDGIGSPLVIELADPLLGFINDLNVDYDANDTLTVRTGIEYQISDKWTALLGYAFDEAIFDDEHVDILVYDSDRHMISAGLMYDTRKSPSDSGWLFNIGLHVTNYERRTIEAGVSQNLGGVSLPNLTDADTLSFVPNQEDFTFGGNILAAGISFQYNFGGN